MEQQIALVMTRSMFEKLATGWYISQVVADPCPCETCSNVDELIADAVEELLIQDAFESEPLDIYDAMTADPRLHQRILTGALPMPRLLIEG